ncbi:MAG: TonB-dependent receptor, partial [Alphaproteobacteria bacterium]|nr:TonB-dependent receptor [Alphaproteobacteria bacterium]
MHHHDRLPRKGGTTFIALLMTTTAAFPALAAETLDEVTVTGTREAELITQTPATVSTVTGVKIREIKPTHPTELFNRLPGVYVSTTNGEGHKASIRHPNTTNPVYLYLEDGIPTRSTGFFNHNALFEVNVPQAGGIEVNKGPGSALQGSDATGGVITVLTREPSTTPETEVSVEIGSHGFWRGLLSTSNGWEDDAARADLNLTHTEGWRKDTEYDRQSVNVRWDHYTPSGASLKTVLAASNIDQQTAGTSRLNLNDYKNNPTENYTPISYREVQAVRLSAAYEREDDGTLLSITPYLRWNEMDMLPNWSLGYDPQVYTSGHSSLGVMGKYRMDFKPYESRLVLGADIDYSPGMRDENRITTTKVGNVYTTYALAEKTYDYDVTFMSASPYVHAEATPMDGMRVSGGLRFDAMRYEYDNNLSVSSTGNYRRHASNTVNFTHFSPKLGVTYDFMPGLNGFASYKHAFR